MAGWMQFLILACLVALFVITDSVTIKERKDERGYLLLIIALQLSMTSILTWAITV